MGPAFAVFPSRLEWVRAGLLALTLAWSVLASGGHPSLAFLVSLVLTLAVVGVHWIITWRSVIGGVRVPAVVWASVPFLVWAAVSAAWLSDAAWVGWIDVVRWTQGVVLFWVGGEAFRAVGARRLVLVTLAVVVAVVVLGAASQLFSDSPLLWPENREVNLDRSRASGPFFAPPSLAGFLVMVIPVPAALLLRSTASSLVRVTAGWLTGILLFGLVLPVSRGGWIALAVAAAWWFVTAGRLQVQARIMRLGVIALIAIALGTFLLALSPVTRGRFEQMMADRGEVSRPVLWRAAVDIFKANPFLGSGGGSYNFAFEGVRPEGFTKDPIWAHSEYLNVLSDYGLVGAVCAALAAAVLVRTLSRATREPMDARQRVSDWSDSSALRAGIRVGLLALALHAAVDFHFRLPGIVVSAALLAALAVRTRDDSAAPEDWRVARRWAIAWSAAAALLLIFKIGPLLRSEAARREGRRLIDGLWGVEVTRPVYGQNLAAAQRNLQAAVALYRGHAQAWSDLAYALALQSHLESARRADLGRAAEIAADHALKLGPGLWEPWIRRSVARDLQGRWFEAGDDSAAALARAPANAEVWYYHAYHLSHRRNERFIALAAAEFCLRLDPQNREAQALRLRLSSGVPGPR